MKDVYTRCVRGLAHGHLHEVLVKRIPAVFRRGAGGAHPRQPLGVLAVSAAFWTITALYAVVFIAISLRQYQRLYPART